MPGCACREEPETFGGDYERDLDMPGAAFAGPAGEPEVDYNLQGGYDAWEAPEMPERFGDVALDGGPPPGAEEPAIGAGASAKWPDKAAAQPGETALTCLLVADPQLRQQCVYQQQWLEVLPAVSLIILGTSPPQGVRLVRKCKVWLIGPQFLQAPKWIW